MNLRLRAPAIGSWILLLAGLVLFVSLGVWQHGRAEFKRDRIERWNQAQQVPAQPWRGTSEHFRAVHLDGQILAKPYLLDNQVRDGQGGIDVFVPMRSDHGVVLLALGWLPYAAGARVPPELPALPDGTVRVQGLWTPAPAHGIRMGRGWSQVPGYPKLMPYFALDEIAADAGLDLGDGVLRVEADPALPYRRDWQPVDAMPPERHLAYAWQWWSLAVAIVVVFLVVHRRRDPDSP